MTAAGNHLSPAVRSVTSTSILSVVIPALNEQDAIGETLSRCLDARHYIIQSGRLSDVEFLVVSDGSTDKTEEIARSFPEVTVLGFAANRGYGAAIKCGFDYARGDLLAFLDADGTCDPRFFSTLVAVLHENGADLALGSRMSRDSKMPLIRTIGNRLFAWLLSTFSKQAVCDTASGMRVIRREALQHLYPLPDGLHFTPAMSARTLLEGRLKLVETPMPYAERTGNSKLRVLSDGLRFLRIIVQAAITFRPARPLLMIAGLCSAASVLFALNPVLFYLQHFRLEEWVIWRVLMSSLMATLATKLVCAAVVADRIAAVTHGRWAGALQTNVLQRVFEPRWRALSQTVLLGAALYVTSPGILQYLQSGQVEMHWSRGVLGALLLSTAVMLAITGFLLRMMRYIALAKDNSSGSRPPDRLRNSMKPACSATLS